MEFELYIDVSVYIIVANKRLNRFQFSFFLLKAEFIESIFSYNLFLTV